jgi:hypothetical protein
MSTTTMPGQHSSSPLHIEDYRDMIVDEAKRLNDRLSKYFKIVLWIMLSVFRYSILHSILHYHLHSQTYLINMIWTEWIIQKASFRIKAILLL